MFLSKENEVTTVLFVTNTYSQKKQEVICDLLDTTFSFTKYLKAVFIFKQD